MNQPRTLPRRLLMIDFSCAFAGAALYFFLYNFMITTLGLPRWVVETQLLANFLYGIYGAVLFGTGVRQTRYFKLLVVMNFAYCGFCFAEGSLLIFTGVHAGAALLLFEGLLIGALAMVEKKSLLK